MVLKGLAVIWGFALAWLCFAWIVKTWVHLILAIPAIFIDKGKQ